MTAVAGLVTALTMGGCTSDDSGDAPANTGTTDAGPDRKAPPPPEAGDDPDAGACPKEVQLTPADLEQSPGWKKPLAAAGACTQADITQLEANFKDTSLQSWFDLGKSVGDPCKACVFAKDTDANWGPIVGTASNNGQTGFINFGACFGFVEGDACGKSLQFEQFCYNVACNECTSTSTERQKCVQKAGATGGVCSAFGDATGKDCPQIQTTAKSCNTIFDAVKTLCGSGPADGGTD